MSYQYSFDPVALAEYKETINWYRARSDSAVNNFISAFDDKVTAICSSPLLYRKTYKSLREVSLVKFPFTIVYFIDEPSKTIVITSVYHHKRDPKKKIRK